MFEEKLQRQYPMNRKDQDVEISDDIERENHHHHFSSLPDTGLVRDLRQPVALRNRANGEADCGGVEKGLENDSSRHSKTSRAT